MQLILKYMSDSMSKYGKAYELAERSHAGVKRKFGPDKGKDYIIHPIRVEMASRIIALRTPYLQKFSDQIGSVAIVHDVVEDDPKHTVETVSDELEFTEWQKIALSLLTKKDKQPYDEFILEIVKLFHESEDTIKSFGAMVAALIKYCDLEDNSASLEGGSMLAKYKLSMYILKREILDLL